jgi:hypothetical protein
VYLELPDASRLEPTLDAPFQELSVEHINFLSPQSPGNLMQARGFRTRTAGRARRAHNETMCLSAYGVFEKSAAAATPERDTETDRGLRPYILGCQAEDARIRSGHYLSLVQPRISDSTRGEISRFSLDTLVTGLIDTGLEVDCRIKGQSRVA